MECPVLFCCVEPHHKSQIILSPHLHLLGWNSSSERQPRGLISTMNSGPLTSCVNQGHFLISQCFILKIGMTVGHTSHDFVRGYYRESVIQSLASSSAVGISINLQCGPQGIHFSNYSYCYCEDPCVSEDVRNLTHDLRTTSCICLRKVFCLFFGGKKTEEK